MSLSEVVQVFQEERGKLISLKSKLPGVDLKFKDLILELFKTLNRKNNKEKSNFNVFNIYILIPEYKLKSNSFKQVMKVTSNNARLEENYDSEKF